MTALNKKALIAKIKKQTESFDTVVLKEDEALALVEALEATEKTSAARKEAIERTHKMFQRERDRAEAAEKRIAELEAREVKLPKPISVLHRRDFNDSHRAIYAYPEAEVNAALAAAGIGVKGE